MKKISFYLLAVSLLLPLSAQAQDAGLYDPVAPAGSAFVRFINNGATEAALKPVVQTKTFEEASFGEATAYVPVRGGQTATIKLGAVSAEQPLVAGGYYTAILQGTTLKVVTDDALSNPAKAMIAFYNLSNHPNLTLKTADGATEVVAPVAQQAGGYRLINGVRVALSVYDGATKLADVGPVDLKRGEATTILVRQPGTEVKVSITQARTDTTQ